MSVVGIELANAKQWLKRSLLIDGSIERLILNGKKGEKSI
jgi:hypothetical protein